jgi:hypothetical protein
VLYQQEIALSFAVQHRRLYEVPHHLHNRQHTSAYVSIRQHTSAYVSSSAPPA